jgi:hypothetical protein
MNAGVGVLRNIWRAIERGVASDEYPIFDASSCPTVGAAGDILWADALLIQKFEQTHGPTRRH